MKSIFKAGLFLAALMLTGCAGGTQEETGSASEEGAASVQTTAREAVTAADYYKRIMGAESMISAYLTGELSPDILDVCYPNEEVVAGNYSVSLQEMYMDYSNIYAVFRIRTQDHSALPKAETADMTEQQLKRWSDVKLFMNFALDENGDEEPEAQEPGYGQDNEGGFRLDDGSIPDTAWILVRLQNYMLYDNIDGWPATFHITGLRFCTDEAVITIYDEADKDSLSVYDDWEIHTNVYIGGDVLKMEDQDKITGYISPVGMFTVFETEPSFFSDGVTMVLSGSGIQPMDNYTISYTGIDKNEMMVKNLCCAFEESIAPELIESIIVEPGIQVYP